MVSDCCWIERSCESPRNIRRSSSSLWIS
ncbi:hypothetical protein OESDEN_02096 [Oesophagostomum dentatum]|uniref:Uncharacterized protein n=1 Tax=Oesophagostomum dentatum TaxID=61180 RepID=A0A0B1TR93_OESDE|nr:hypothetical protein OESDEN_02096 [Oesophagostomum dentatum]